MSNKILSGQRIYNLKNRDNLTLGSFDIDFSEYARMTHFCRMHGEVYKGSNNCPKCKEIQKKYNL